MRAQVFKRYGEPDQVAFADISRPVPKSDEILVQVHTVLVPLLLIMYGLVFRLPLKT